MIIKEYAKTAWVAINNWWERDPFTQSAAVAYYTIFSFPALMILYFAAASVFVEEHTLKYQTYQFLAQKFGEASASQFREIIERSAPAETSIGAVILGGCVLLYAGLRLFMQLQKALNYIWQVDDKSVSNLRKILWRRLVSFGVMLAIGFSLVVSLTLTSLITMLTEWFMRYLPDYFAYLFHALNFTFSLTLLSFMFAVLLKKLPDAHVRWRYAIGGGIVTALFFILGEYGLSIYFSLAKPDSAYGVTGSIILLMIWVSYSCVVLLLGAEFSRALHFKECKLNKSN